MEASLYIYNCIMFICTFLFKAKYRQNGDNLSFLGNVNVHYKDILHNILNSILYIINHNDCYN